MHPLKTVCSGLCWILLAWPHFAFAHGFSERYDLPVPMRWVILCACMVVLMSFLWTPFLKSKDPQAPFFILNLSPSNACFQPPSRTSMQEALLLSLSSGLLALTWACSAWGSEDPLMNFAPTFIWIIWWLGVSFGCMLFGNFWYKIDPWRGFYLGFKYAKNFLAPPPLNNKHDAQNHALLNWPPTWGLWPATLSLLLWCGLEIIYPIASMPHRLGLFIALYSLYMWLGMYVFGQAQWSARADGFSLYFELIGQTRDMLIEALKSKSLRAPDSVTPIPSEALGSERHEPQLHLSTVSLGLAMFTSVLFDGLHAGPTWWWFEKLLAPLPIMRNDVNGYLTGALGLIALWLGLLVIYILTCHLTKKIFLCVPQVKQQQIAFKISTLGLAHSFLSSLLPIACAYLIAHNFSAFFIQGQNIIALASDPFGLSWNLFGTAHYYPDIRWIDAKLTWYVASISIVLGHVVSIFMAHKVASCYSAQLHQLSFKAMLADPTLQLEVTTLKPWILNVPMTLVMMGFTALSLSIIAEPLTNAMPG